VFESWRERAEELETEVYALGLALRHPRAPLAAKAVMALVVAYPLVFVPVMDLLAGFGIPFGEAAIGVTGLWVLLMVVVGITARRRYGTGMNYRFPERDIETDSLSARDDESRSSDRDEADRTVLHERE